MYPLNLFIFVFFKLTKGSKSTSCIVSVFGVFFWLCNLFFFKKWKAQPKKAKNGKHSLSRKTQFMRTRNYNLSIVSNSNLISFQTSQADANSGLHLQAARITSPPSRARSRPSLRA